MPNVVETTNVKNEKYRTHEPKCGADFFNLLSPIPKDHIDLGDGRELRITKWVPIGLTGRSVKKGGNDISDGVLPISIEGIITLKTKLKDRPLPTENIKIGYKEKL